MKIGVTIFLFIYLVQELNGENQKTIPKTAMKDHRTSDKEQQQKKTMAFEKDQLYRDFFLLTHSNFTRSVIQSKMAWVVFFHDGMLERAWKLSAVNFRGIIRFGMVDRTQESKLLKELKLAANTSARLYPYGGKIVKKKYYEDVIDGMDAVNKAEESLPDRIPKLEDKGRIEEVLLESYTSLPSKFPLLVLTRESSTPTLFRALALRFERYFNFRLLKDPSVDKMRRLGLPTDFYYHVPGLVALITENFEDEASRKFYAVQFDKSAMGGDLSYPNCVMFLLQVNRQFRHTLPGDNEDDVEDTVKATDVMLAEQEIFDIKDEFFSKKARTRWAAKTNPEEEESKPEPRDPYHGAHTEEL